MDKELAFKHIEHALTRMTNYPCEADYAADAQEALGFLRASFPAEANTSETPNSCRPDSWPEMEELYQLVDNIRETQIPATKERTFNPEIDMEEPVLSGREAAERIEAIIRKRLASRPAPSAEKALRAQAVVARMTFEAARAHQEAVNSGGWLYDHTEIMRELQAELDALLAHEAPKAPIVFAPDAQVCVLCSGNEHAVIISDDTTTKELRISQETARSLRDALNGLYDDEPASEAPKEERYDAATLKAANRELAAWAMDRWNAEVKNRPIENVHRRTLDATWRQVYRYATGEEMPTGAALAERKERE